MFGRGAFRGIFEVSVLRRYALRAVFDFENPTGVRGFVGDHHIEFADSKLQFESALSPGKSFDGLKKNDFFHEATSDFR